MCEEACASLQSLCFCPNKGGEERERTKERKKERERERKKELERETETDLSLSLDRGSIIPPIGAEWVNTVVSLNNHSAVLRIFVILVRFWGAIINILIGSLGRFVCVWVFLVCVCVSAHTHQAHRYVLEKSVLPVPIYV